MGKTGFWVEWELWEKMCFVLGCLIVIVLLYGAGVQIYNSWRIQKVAAAEMQLRSHCHVRAGIEGAQDNDIPFGSRAIESGVEVEGIWISNHNTPRGTPLPPATPEETRPPSPRPTQVLSLDSPALALNRSS
ncbi:hypothetical protein CIHG_08661 [Coccidioides immitis H538.4]|uniref:Uncharacterized protein n=3 Tax=Coccidioides immitis TaxID=5501 RepID=A0A0J8QNM1_COCIT|nr:hypothetical protein CIRG_09860 [Coccidioides immitis RMSCC 2394]KMU74039.1 hypothetical protein CISG_10291 [Coccidioides immitis RMSCC 3703]KMU90857.1 hypothetical protein CIHG_08661 [Coccidioides immitis H538.4]TPX20462.1 hypothetical protein DIZ76_016351 [Coccidioides immitis]